MLRAERGESVTLLLNVETPRKLWALPPDTEARLAERFPQVRVLKARDKASFLADIARTDILYTWHLPRETLSLARRLKWVHTPAAGVDHLLHPSLRHSDVVLTNSRGLAGDAMADHVFALILAMARRIPESLRFAAHQRWGQEEIWAGTAPPVSLAGKTLGIIGFGGVGLQLAVRARAFGMTVIASCRTQGKPPRGVSALLTPDRNPELLAESDFVVLCAPLTPETRGLIGAKELRRMKKTACLVNVARGEMVIEAALIRALREGWVAGAALDVFQREPLPKNSVLWRIPRLLITPHTAGTYPEHMARATDLFLENLDLFLKGKTKRLKNVVDKASGY